MSFSFPQVLRITTSGRVRTLALWELTRMDASGICFAVCQANGQNPIALSQLCQFPITIRSTAPTAPGGIFVYPRGVEFRRRRAGTAKSYLSRLVGWAVPPRRLQSQKNRALAGAA